MGRPIRIAVASGKGGTGKTTIATNLAVVQAGMGVAVAYLDCDVEEPNGHIFLKPTIHKSHKVSIPVPEVDESRCTLCGACGQACRYSAILSLPKKVLTFPKLCHGCGGCTLSCPEDAIREVPRTIGVVEHGFSGRVGFIQGRLNIGEAMTPPVIRALLESAPWGRTIILDAPPGTSCPVIESVKTADLVLLVTEPTPFGLNDLKLAVGMVRELGLPLGVAVNRAGIGDDQVLEYCKREQIPVLLELPNDREIAHAYSRGVLAVEALPWVKPLFVNLSGKLRELARHEVKSREMPPSHATQVPTEIARMPSEILQPAQNGKLRELVVVSGKGGTGKTSIVASFSALAGQASVADCDVDAADLHLILDPAVQNRWPFSGSHEAFIDAQRCITCCLCIDHCRFGAIDLVSNSAGSSCQVDPISCEGCGVCADICPEQAIEMAASANGEWFVSEARHSPMVHACLGIAQDNSGKLVSLVRREAKALSSSGGQDLLICDGSPGIGCPVIASIAGAQMVLVVTEPTLSGLHDLRRIAELTRQFNVKAGVCINKTDINPELSGKIEKEAAELGLQIFGRVHYDDSVTRAQVRRMAVVENGDGPAAKDIRALWRRVLDEIA